MSKIEKSLCSKHGLPVKFWPLNHCNECRRETLRVVRDKIDPNIMSGDIVSYFDNNYILEKINGDGGFLKAYVHNPVDVEDLVFVSRQPAIERLSKNGKRVLSKIIDIALEAL